MQKVTVTWTKTGKVDKRCAAFRRGLVDEDGNPVAPIKPAAPTEPEEIVVRPPQVEHHHDAYTLEGHHLRYTVDGRPDHRSSAWKHGEVQDDGAPIETEILPADQVEIPPPHKPFSEATTSYGHHVRYDADGFVDHRSQAYIRGEVTDDGTELGRNRVLPDGTKLHVTTTGHVDRRSAAFKHHLVDEAGHQLPQEQA
ncbi:hypothetical protein J8273_7139 [Carpediemonas membranifera]|uniref:Uncharacterized protein n=1 Tax=Carpediemonas membranifera TaxID=201153 RepID=A0A8J6AZ88_9EUKA|nr:hypothetical protein J8273_7139 [Carpediemonas membranifera]|eukprot:KAG9390874.1 hypothetical protein J8273_7139 [Carpediemonas membranifera]